MVEGDFAVRISVDTADVAPDINISDDLTISTGASGTFTISIDRVPQTMTSVIYSLEGDDIVVTPTGPVEFTVDDFGPQVLTVTHIGEGATSSSITFTKILEDVGEVSAQSDTRQITVIEAYAVPVVSVSGNMMLHPGGEGFITISLNKAPGAEIILIGLDPLPEEKVDSLMVSPKPVLSFTQSNWAPRVLTVEHIGVDGGENSVVGITATGAVQNHINLALSQNAGQATLSGFEIVATKKLDFTATGFVQANGRYLATDKDFTSPFADTCGINAVHDSRLRFRKDGLTIIQSFDTDICPALDVMATLSVIE